MHTLLFWAPRLGECIVLNTSINYSVIHARHFWQMLTQ